MFYKVEILDSGPVEMHASTSGRVAGDATRTRFTRCTLDCLGAGVTAASSGAAASSPGIWETGSDGYGVGGRKEAHVMSCTLHHTVIFWMVQQPRQTRPSRH